MLKAAPASLVPRASGLHRQGSPPATSAKIVGQENGMISWDRRPSRHAVIATRGGTEIKWRAPQLRVPTAVRTVGQERITIRKARRPCRRANSGAGALPGNLCPFLALFLTIIYARIVQQLPLSMLRQVLIAE